MFPLWQFIYNHFQLCDLFIQSIKSCLCTRQFLLSLRDNRNHHFFLIQKHIECQFLMSVCLSLITLNIYAETKKDVTYHQVTSLISSATGTRTRVSAVRGPRPRPLDECAICCPYDSAKVKIYFNPTNSFAKKLFLLPL